MKHYGALRQCYFNNLVRDVIDAISAKCCRILSKNEKYGAQRYSTIKVRKI